ncbi:hypothetical protein ACFE04_027427 [Oxalis oulophora]
MASSFTLFGRDQYLLSQGATKLYMRPFNNPNRVILNDVSDSLPAINKTMPPNSQATPAFHHFLNALSTRDSILPPNNNNNNNNNIVLVVETDTTKFVFVDGMADPNAPHLTNLLQHGDVKIVDIGDENGKVGGCGGTLTSEEKLARYNNQVTKILQILGLDQAQAQAPAPDHIGDEKVVVEEGHGDIVPLIN